jgi:hypothetical protein
VELLLLELMITMINMAFQSKKIMKSITIWRLFSKKKEEEEASLAREVLEAI